MSNNVCDPDVINVVPKIFKALGKHSPKTLRKLADLDGRSESLHQWASENKLCSNVVIEYAVTLKNAWLHHPDGDLGPPNADHEWWGFVTVVMSREGFQEWLAEQPALVPNAYESLRSFLKRATAFYHECENRGGAGVGPRDAWSAVDRHAEWFVLNRVLGRSISDILAAEPDVEESTVRRAVARVADVISFRNLA